jgi:hypothetical protein
LLCVTLGKRPGRAFEATVAAAASGAQVPQIKKAARRLLFFATEATQAVVADLPLDVGLRAVFLLELLRRGLPYRRFLLARIERDGIPRTPRRASSFASVERVLNLLPQLQMTSISLYSGMNLAFSWRCPRVGAGVRRAAIIP